MVAGPRNHFHIHPTHKQRPSEPGRWGQGGGQISLACGLALLQLVELRLRPGACGPSAMASIRPRSLQLTTSSFAALEAQVDPRLCRRAVVQ